MNQANLKQNFARILRQLEEHEGMKKTAIAKKIGYTTTAQLNSTLTGDSLLSSKAIMKLIKNLKVNPTYLFLGKGEMFLTDDTELDKLQKEVSDWKQKYFETQDELLKCKKELEQAVRRYNKLIDITSLAMDNAKKEKKENNDNSESE